MGKKVLTRQGIYNRDVDHIEAENRRKARKDSPDTVDRKQIHESIKKMLKDGKGRIEILAELNNSYPNTYMSQFFETWIDYHMKTTLIPNKNKEEEQERWINEN